MSEPSGEGITITIHAATEEGAEKLTEFFDKVNEHLNELTKASEFLQGLGEKIAEAFTIAAIIEEFNKAREAIEQMGHAVEKTGLSLQALNALKTLGLENNLPFEELVIGLSMFNDKIFQAVRMGGDAARVFRDLKIPITDMNGALLPTEGILDKVMDRFRQMPDGPQKTGLAMEMFGRSAREMIPFLNEGSDALDKLKGSDGGITSEMIENARQFHVSMVELANAFEEVFIAASGKLLPTIKDATASLKKTEEQTNATGKSSSFLVVVMRGLADVAMTVHTAFGMIGAAMAGVVLFAIKELSDEVSTTIAVFKTWWEILKAILSTLGDMAVKAANVSGVMSALASGDFKGAWDAARKTIADIKEDMGSLGFIAKNAFETTLGAYNDLVDRRFARLKKIAEITWGEITGKAVTWMSALNSIWYSQSGGKPASGEGSEGEGKKAGGFTTGNITSDEAKKLELQLLQQYREATSSKLQLLDYERDQSKKKLALEITDKEDLAQASYLVDEMYAAKKRELLEKSADEERQISLENAKAAADAVDRDPDLTAAEKKQQLLPLLQRERDLLQQILDIQNQRSADPSRNKDQQEQARKDAANAQRQLAQVDDKSKTAQQTPFDKTLVQLRQQNDLQTEVARSFANVFDNAVSSISNGITGLIEGTKNWGQALREIGSSILNSIISAIVEMGVRWVATQLMMAAFTQAASLSTTAALVPIAAAQAAIWATPATLATIASFGEAAAQAPAFMAIALGAGQAMSFESGGMIPAGQRLIQVNENGQEAVINARGVQFLGPDFINSINAGIPNAATLGSRIFGGITQPITADARSYQQMVASGAAARSAGGSGNVNVEGHRMSVAFVNGKNDMRDYLNSAEGEKHIVDISKRRRVDIGIPT